MTNSTIDFNIEYKYVQILLNALLMFEGVPFVTSVKQKPIASEIEIDHLRDYLREGRDRVLSSFEASGYSGLVAWEKTMATCSCIKLTERQLQIATQAIRGVLDECRNWPGQLEIHVGKTEEVTYLYGLLR